MEKEVSVAVNDKESRIIFVDHQHGDMSVSLQFVIKEIEGSHGNENVSINLKYVKQELKFSLIFIVWLSSFSFPST